MNAPKPPPSSAGVPQTFPSGGELLQRAKSLAFVRPLGLYPGWHFGADWDRPEADYRARQEIWQECKLRRPAAPMEYEWYGGLRLNLHMGNDLSRQLYVGGCADPNEFAFLDQFLKPGMTVIDAGANAGLYSLFAARRVGPAGAVLSFEPSEREFLRLQQNIALNGLRNVRAMRAALTDEDGEAEMQIAGDDHEGQNTLGSFVHQGVELLRAERVTLRRLDTVQAQERLTRIDLIKMDVEGGEARLLQGARGVLQEFRPLILFEASDGALRTQGSSREQLLALLREAGYLIYATGSDGRPVWAVEENSGENLMAAPAEAPLPQEWCGDLSAAATSRREEEDKVGGFKPGVAYWNQRHRLAASRDRILALSAAADRPTDLQPFQFAQLMAVAMDFHPETIVELGRGRGNSTCAFVEASNQSGGSIRVVSLCMSDEWHKLTVPRLRRVVPEDWFAPLEALQGDILQFDFAGVLSGVSRAILFWDAHGFEIAECVLGEILPLLGGKDHVVLMHDLSDTRYMSREQLEYGANGLWKNNDWTGPRLKIGIVDSAVEQSIAALDFTTRNRLTLDSADHSFHTDLSPGQQDEMKAVLGDLFDTQGHWFHFSLNEHNGPYTFPRFAKPAATSAAKPWWRWR
ncbi:MAG: FkbM family methyltransferase [Bryobacteraceae bacterium]|jgi:FkbM family methyltransferase